MKKVFQIGNGFAFISVVIINYLSNTGLMNNTTIGKVSDNYKSLFTPAGYTFAIWGIIYLFLFGFVVYQGRSLWSKSVKNDDFIMHTGWWFIISCISNACWVLAWIYEYTGLSCIIILVLLFSLLKIVVNNRMQLEEATWVKTALFYWPFAIYSGWVTVASIANISTYLIKIEWNGFGISQLVWALLLIAIATSINILVLHKRKMRAFVIVGVWALVGIANANKSNLDSIITYTAFSAAILLFILSVISNFKMSSK